jgi:DNA-binding transcriptional regulator YhcF (GntR family)
VTPEEEATMTAALRKAAQAKRRTEARDEQARERLREAILQAHADGMRPSKIVEAIDRYYTDAHVSRVIHGKA